MDCNLKQMHASSPTHLPKMEWHTFPGFPRIYIHASVSCRHYKFQFKVVQPNMHQHSPTSLSPHQCCWCYNGESESGNELPGPRYTARSSIRACVILTNHFARVAYWSIHPSASVTILNITSNANALTFLGYSSGKEAHNTKTPPDFPQVGASQQGTYAVKFTRV